MSGPLLHRQVRPGSGSKKAVFNFNSIRFESFSGTRCLFGVISSRSFHSPVNTTIIITSLLELSSNTSHATAISSNRTRKTITSFSFQSPQLDTLTPKQKDQVSLYVDTLLQWNQRMNLTAVTEASEVMKRHVEDSLAIIPPIQSHYLSKCDSTCDRLNLVDVGSGAGLPGLIFAIACPGWNVTLLESMQKRCMFLEHAVGLIGLSNVEILCARAETVGQNHDSREMFDVAVARAVAEMRVLAEYCLPLVRVGGLFVAAKGYDPQEEVSSSKKAIQLMGASILAMCSVESHGPFGQRTAVVCLKDSPTPKKYPRNPGTPAKIPL
ncbi:Ribosomal RNA small subunit methyltransferase G [Cinnamomum micranthum f. kanehirae]|uniref:Ribosomal RNA small subunit methyltransferase G n=1 Tax=Cinnamomum micranthum f. kanehirae TaxID=337451 RepID=A0A3S3R7J5_9MAGN|nr:Ribosomal RNA small subunit methyltransferase G [Cinnamomum micranthum f. kanehirae]